MNTPEFDFDSPVIKALGSLFKLTEVYLRQAALYFLHPFFNSIFLVFNLTSSLCFSSDDGCSKDDIRQASSFPKHIVRFLIHYLSTISFF